jgi:hypothetical protein
MNRKPPARATGCEQAPQESFLQLHCGETLEAIDRICDWVDG